MREGVVVSLLHLDKLVHGAEHKTLLVLEEAFEGLIMELHVLLNLYLEVLALIQLAEISNHVFGNQLFFKHLPVLSPHHVCLLQLVHAFPR